MFSVLAYSNLVAIGLGRTKEIKKGVWLVRNAYVKPEFRNMGIQQKILALRLNEIIKREGTKALTVVRTDNPISKHNIEKFGFKKISLINQVIKIGRSALKENIFELDLKDKEVIKKIEEILNKK